MAKTIGIEMEGWGLTYQEATDAILNVLGGASLTRVTNTHEVARYEQREGVKVTVINNGHTSMGPTFWNGYTWQVMYDGSLNQPNSFEIVSPVLKGKEGEKQARKVIKALDKAGAKTHIEAGLHITLGTANSRWQRMGVKKTIETLHTLQQSYSYFQEAIGSILAPSRRRDGNGWAHIMNRDIDEIEYCLTSSQFSKYEAVNLKKFATLGCIEYRQHQSTFNADKILNWIRMLHKFQTTAVNEENTHHDMNMYEPDSIQSLMSYLGMPSASSRYFGQRALQLRR